MTPAGMPSAPISPPSPLRTIGSVPAAANSPQTINVSVTVRGVLPDINEDGDVDQTGFATLQICYSPSPPVAVPPTCTKANFDDDEVVDQTDLSPSGMHIGLRRAGRQDV